MIAFNFDSIAECCAFVNNHELIAGDGGHVHFLGVDVAEQSGNGLVRGPGCVQTCDDVRPSDDDLDWAPRAVKPPGPA